MLNMFIAPSDISSVGQQFYHFVTGRMDIDDSKTCNENCFFHSIVGKGDFSDIEVHSKHKIAEDARQEREHSKDT